MHAGLFEKYMKLNIYINFRTYFIFLICYLFVLFFPISVSGEALNVQDMSVGLPIGGGSDDPDYELCPKGVRVVNAFIDAWKKGDQTAMYDLLDDKAKESYSRQQAIFDFRLLVYKPYIISSIKRRGDDFEFILTSGSWQEGDKELRKMIINGMSGKVMMPTRNSPFKRSAEDYL